MTSALSQHNNILFFNNNNNTKTGDGNDGWVSRFLRPGWNFNPLAFVLSAMVAMMLLGGVKESKTVTNYFTALKMMGILTMTLTGLSLLNVQNPTPFLPPTLGMNGFFRGGTVSFMGFLGFDEVCCRPRQVLTRSIRAYCFLSRFG